MTFTYLELFFCFILNLYDSSRLRMIDFKDAENDSKNSSNSFLQLLEIKIKLFLKDLNCNIWVWTPYYKVTL